MADKSLYEIEDEEEYEAELQRIEERRRKAELADDEALKHEKWACKVGDLLEVVRDVTFHGTAEEQINGTAVKTTMSAQGQVYRAADLKGRGWDLVRVSGEGPEEIRVMNWDVRRYFDLVHDAPEEP